MDHRTNGERETSQGRDVSREEQDRITLAPLSILEALRGLLETENKDKIAKIGSRKKGKSKAR